MRRRIHPSWLSLSVSLLALGCDSEPLSPGRSDAPERDYITSTSSLLGLGTLGGSNSFAEGVNGLGTVVGRSEVSGGATHAFVRPAGGPIIDIGTLGGTFANATAINDAGTVVGYSGTSTGNRAFRGTSSGMVGISMPPGGVESFAMDINASGTIVGYYRSSTGRMNALYWRPDNTPVPLAAPPGAIEWYAEGINDAGDIVGYAQVGTTSSFIFQPLIWPAGGAPVALPTAAGRNSGFAFDLNEAGAIAGTATNVACTTSCSSSSFQAAVWLSRTATPVVIGLSGHARGINNANVAVIGGGGSAAIWSPETGFRFLPGGSEGLAINDAGLAVGALFTGSGPQQAAQWTVGTMAQPVCGIVPTNLLGWWRGEGNAADATGVNAGVLRNGVAFTQGAVTSAFSLDGVDDYIEVPGPSSIVTSLATSLTFEAWVKWNGAGEGAVVSIGDGDAAEANRFVRLSIAPNGRPVFEHRMNGDPSTLTLTGSTALAPGTWHHLAGVRNTATAQAQLYVDGVLAASAFDIRGSFVLFGIYTIRPLSIGATAVGTAAGARGFFPGAMDEVRVWGRALTQAEIQSSAACANHAPSATAQSVTTDEDVAAAVTLAGTDPDGDALTFAVASQPANGTLSGTAPNLTYTPNAGFEGGDSFTFTASDPAGATSAPATVSITVNHVNHAPGAQAGGPYATAEGGAVSFAGAGSDPDGDALSYAWDFGDGTTGTGATPNHVYADNGSYTATLTASDPSGAIGTSSATVTVSNVAPTARLGQDRLIFTGRTLTVYGAAADPGAADGPFAYTIDWGDGSPPYVGSAATLGNLPAAMHDYTAAGTLTVTLRVTDKDGAQGADQLVLQVAAVPRTSTVFLDVMPGVSPNVVSIQNAAPLPVAILGTAAFSAANVVPSSIWAGTGDGGFVHPVTDAARCGGACTQLADVNGDGVQDLVVYFELRELFLDPVTATVTPTLTVWGKLLNTSTWKGAQALTVTP